MKRRTRERGSSSGSSGLLFPIGVGLGAIVAIALFLGFRSGTALDGGTGGTPLAVVPADGSGALPADRSTADADAVTADGRDDVEPSGPAEAVATTSADDPPTAGAERLGVIGALANPAGEAVTTDLAGASGLPSADDPGTADLFGGRIVMVSSAVPRVIVLADGTNLVPGETLPSGHRIIDIERERILLERDGAEWRVQVP